MKSIVLKNWTAGKKVDTSHEYALYSALQRFGMFSMDNNNKLHFNIVTKDLATPNIENALVKAAELRQAQLETFVQKR